MSGSLENPPEAQNNEKSKNARKFRAMRSTRGSQRNIEVRCLAVVPGSSGGWVAGRMPGGTEWIIRLGPLFSLDEDPLILYEPPLLRPQRLSNKKFFIIQPQVQII